MPKTRPWSTNWTLPPGPSKHSIAGGGWSNVSRVKLWGRGSGRASSLAFHSTTTNVTPLGGGPYCAIWQGTCLSWTGAEEATTRVSGSMTLPSAGFPACQPGGSSTVTPTSPVLVWASSAARREGDISPSPPQPQTIETRRTKAKPRSTLISPTEPSREAPSAVERGIRIHRAAPERPASEAGKRLDFHPPGGRHQAPPADVLVVEEQTASIGRVRCENSILPASWRIQPAGRVVMHPTGSSG